MQSYSKRFDAGELIFSEGDAPTGAFLQLGAAESTESATAGLIWRWSRQWR